MALNLWAINGSDFLQSTAFFIPYNHNIPNPMSHHLLFSSHDPGLVTELRGGNTKFKELVESSREATSLALDLILRGKRETYSLKNSSSLLAYFWAYCLNDLSWIKHMSVLL